MYMYMYYVFTVGFLIGGKGCNEGTIVITKDEMDRHNQKAVGGAWTIMNGKVYNIDTLAEQVNKTCNIHYTCTCTM